MVAGQQPTLNMFHFSWKLHLHGEKFYFLMALSSAVDAITFLKMLIWFKMWCYILHDSSFLSCSSNRSTKRVLFSQELAALNVTLHLLCCGLVGANPSVPGPGCPVDVQGSPSWFVRCSPHIERFSRLRRKERNGMSDFVIEEHWGTPPTDGAGHLSREAHVLVWNEHGLK